mgnify:CR=1 FL=1
MRGKVLHMDKISVEAFADYGMVSRVDAESYLAECSDVAELPGGALVRRGRIVHIVARQRGLSGRRLVMGIRKALAKFHEAEPVLTCPVSLENKRALRLARFFNFKPYQQTETHQWLYRNRGDQL